MVIPSEEMKKGLETEPAGTPQERQEPVEKAEKIEYALKEPPKWFIQGSYVLDYIFGKALARDVDVFVPEGSAMPAIEDSRPLHGTELVPDAFFPPLLGKYNIDRYLLTSKGVIKPVGFPERPATIELLGGKNLTVIDVIRGIKASKRYELVVSPEVRTAWEKTLVAEFNPIAMDMMAFNSEEEVLEYLRNVLSEETGENERMEVAQEISHMLRKDLLPNS